MIGGIFSRLARVQFTVGYVAVLLGISCAILMLGPHAHDVLRSARQYQPAQPGPQATSEHYLGGALVVDAGPLYFGCPS